MLARIKVSTKINRNFSSMPFYAQHIKSARLHLQKNDPVMKRILKSVGPFVAKTRRDRFGTLVNSIVSQQISVAAARTIRQRLLDGTGDGTRNAKFTPEAIVKFDVESLREKGLSRQKATYVLDLAEKVNSGAIELTGIQTKTDEEVVETLTQVNGIGRWTAQMFLMFSLGRLNILPVDDLGIKNAIRKQYELDEVPDKTQIEQLAENWRPYATVACWYLWQSLEMEVL